MKFDDIIQTKFEQLDEAIPGQTAQAPVGTQPTTGTQPQATTTTQPAPQPATTQQTPEDQLAKAFASWDYTKPETSQRIANVIAGLQKTNPNFAKWYQSVLQQGQVGTSTTQPTPAA